MRGACVYVCVFMVGGRGCVCGDVLHLLYEHNVVLPIHSYDGNFATRTPQV